MKKIPLLPFILLLLTCSHFIADTTSYPSGKTESISLTLKHIELCEIPGNEADHTLF